MRINWVFAEGYKIEAKVDQIKSIGPTWGSWKTFKKCSTDNVICHDAKKSQELIAKAIQAVCNFYIPKKYYADLGKPIGVKLYEGEFPESVAHAEDIVSMHLAANQSDIVLLAGFDFSKAEKENQKPYLGMARSVINTDPNVQWVLVDHSNDLDPAFQNLSNLTCDSFENVLKLLV